MAKMFGFISNRPDAGCAALARNREALCLHNEGREAFGWGVGFYQTGEVLLRRRPSDDRAVIDLTLTTSKLRADVLIGHIRRPTLGTLRTENTHPFRYRQWLFAHSGSHPAAAELSDKLLESQPQFLRANVRGDTDSEVYFYSFLSFLHESGFLTDHLARPEPVLDALRKLVKLENRLCDQGGYPIGKSDMLVTNGEYLIALHRSGTLAQRNYYAADDLADLLRAEGELSASPSHTLEGTRVCLVASGLKSLPAGWEPLEAGSLLVATRSLPPEVFSL